MECEWDLIQWEDCAVFSLFDLSADCNHYLRNVPFYVRYIELHGSDITTESNSSLYCSQRSIM